MRSFSQLWPTLKRLLAYGSPWRKPLGIAVLMMWVAAAVFSVLQHCFWVQTVPSVLTLTKLR